MNNRFTLQDVAGFLAERTGRTKKDSEEFLRVLIQVLAEGVFGDRMVKVKGLGTFKIVKVEDRESVHVNTGERFIIPGHYKFNFSPDKELKELVNKPFSFFDTTEINNEEKLYQLAATTEEKTESTEEEEEREDNEDAPVAVSPLEVAVSDIAGIVAEEKAEDPQIEEVKPVAEESQIIVDETGDKPVEEKVVNIREEEPVEEVITENRKNKVLLMLILIFMVCCLALFPFFCVKWVKGSGGHSPDFIPHAVETTVELPQEKEAPVVTEVIAPSDEAPEPPAETLPATPPEPLGEVTIEPGSRLTLLALEYYGHKIFWVYIYEYNKERISDPNNIPVGTTLTIPAPQVYGINAKDRESIAKASSLQTQIVNH